MAMVFGRYSVGIRREDEPANEAIGQWVAIVAWLMMFGGAALWVYSCRPH